MTRVLMPVLQSVLAAVCCSLLVLLAGCGGASTVEAVPRANSNAPVFGMGEEVTAVESSNELDLGFIHEDHFACLTINVAKVISNPELSDAPWDLLEAQLAEFLGPDNASLKNVNRAWVLVDRDGIPGGQEAAPVSPLVYVLDFETIPNQSQLIETVQKKVKEPDVDGSGMVVTQMGDNRIVIGSQSLTSKISNGMSENSLSRQLKQMKLDSDVDGIVGIGPIRSILQSGFGVAASFMGEEAAKLSKLPSVLDRVELSIALDSEVLLQTVIYIDDEEQAISLANFINESAQPNSSGGGLGIPIGMFGGGQEREAMILSTAETVLGEVGQEIVDKGLFSIEGKDRKVTFTLARPSQLNQLIQASLIDGKRQLELASRVGNLKKIGIAMEAYVEKHGCFPPSGIVTESADGLPNQFSWRVGLLPFLGEQTLYNQFDFSEPWDSKKNQEVASQMPEVYADASFDEGNKPAIVSRWHVVGGKSGLFKDDVAPKLSDIADNKKWTAIVIEGGEQKAENWTKPGALTVGSEDFKQLGRDQENGVLFLNGAFEPRIVKRDSGNLQSVITPQGDETMRRSDFLPLLPGQ